mgnify:CR=1 FL=1
MTLASQRHRVVVIGSGFGGLQAAKALKRADVDITLIARTTHHLFQPMLYQVATGIVSEGEIAPATRIILRHQKNATVLLGDVFDIDVNAAPRQLCADGAQPIPPPLGPLGQVGFELVPGAAGVKGQHVNGLAAVIARELDPAHRPLPEALGGCGMARAGVVIGQAEDLDAALARLRTHGVGRHGSI